MRIEFVRNENLIILLFSFSLNSYLLRPLPISCLFTCARF